MRNEGYACDCADDANEAADLLKKEDYDLLISDIKMPGNHDLKLIKSIAGKGKNLPTILVTGYPSARSAIDSIQLPVVAYLVKPIDFDELLKQVQNAVSHRRVYQTVVNTKILLNLWSNDLGNIGQLMEKGLDEFAPKGIESYFLLTLKNIALCLGDLRNISEILASDEPRQDLNNIPGLPELNAMRNAISESIEVLEKTKKSFKSKELGKLRNKLEQIVTI